MRNLFTNIIIGLFALGVCASCDSFLDETPDNRLRLDSYEKVAELLTNAYPNGSGVFMEWMSDNVGADPKNVQRLDMTQAYRWQNVELEGQDTPSFYWSSHYNAIAHANQALLALKEISEKNTERRNAIRGEALACRAFAHFMLVNVFAKTYDPQTAATDPGVVIMEKAEVTLLAQYKRSSVQEVYDFIEKDLLEAIDLASDRFLKNSGKYHFNRSAILAFASRFFLFKKDYPKAEKYATELLGHGYNPQFIRDYSQVYTGASSEVIARKFTDPALMSNLLLIRKDVLYGYKAYTGYRFNQDVYQSMVISKNDKRFSVSYSYGNGSTTSFLPKFQRDLIRRTSITSSSGFPYTVEVALRGEEVFFNRLEAWAMMGNEKKTEFESQFGAYLNAVYGGTIDYVTLYNGYKKIFQDLDENALRMKMVLDERRREFVEEGLRWFDIRRHYLPVVHVDMEGTVNTLMPNDPRKVLQIPQTAITHGGLQPNVREDSSEPKEHLVTYN
ncbi:RagB/SusD family nutrient uptake outer membrane protein [Bacteroides pyogenes]|uniref:RagB/SusD family nutrient uptake outer membrane protein n=1 Tax=Bacteroides pyogenes TaxID=310300 RepID=A0A5D3FE11_9BACE|nr:RagB/SusD family nutrient uptake outer membrane protein [Bacteroides pyogenes]TYK32356.1 RagB/SusD family nutrient uptake outer membrane protein [Bacteroides pyogenes]TYK45505.1 RagB/SusD family nutrient uptake outer membrane protein [Bacteroides pyogenes]